MSTHCTQQHLIEKKKKNYPHLHSMYKHTHQEYGFWKKWRLHWGRNSEPLSCSAAETTAEDFQIEHHQVNKRESAALAVTERHGVKKKIYIKSARWTRLLYTNQQRRVSDRETRFSSFNLKKPSLKDETQWRPRLQGFDICFMYYFGGLSGWDFTEAEHKQKMF